MNAADREAGIDCNGSMDYLLQDIQSDMMQFTVPEAFRARRTHVDDLLTMQQSVCLVEENLCEGEVKKIRFKVPSSRRSNTSQPSIPVEASIPSLNW